MNKFNTAAAAAYLDVSAHHLASMRSRGRGPLFVKEGRLVFYRKADLDAWNKNRLAPKAERVKRLLAKASELDARASKLRSEAAQLQAMAA